MSPAKRHEHLCERRAAYAALGGIARAANLTPARRREIARNAANVRWHGGTPLTVEPMLEAQGPGRSPGEHRPLLYSEVLEKLCLSTPPSVGANGYPKDVVGV